MALDNSESDVCGLDCEVLARTTKNMDYNYGDNTGDRLVSNLVEEGCLEELRRFTKRGIYEPILRADALADPEMKGTSMIRSRV